MIEFILRSEELGKTSALGMALGLSATFRRVLVIGEFNERDLSPLMNMGVWGAVVISPCAPGLKCFKDIEEAAEFSEAEGAPVGYMGEAPAPRQFRISTFNKHYLRYNRWIIKNNNFNYFDYIPLFSCIYNLIKLRNDVPIVVSDVYLPTTGEGGPDYQVLPTFHMDVDVAEVVDIYAQPLPAASIAEGILMGGYKAGPVVAITLRPAPKVAELGGYVVDLSSKGDPCELFEKRVVGYSSEIFKGVYEVEPSLCDRCGDCFRARCPALKIGKGGVPELGADCVGCGACALLCSRGAIRRKGDVFRAYLGK